MARPMNLTDDEHAMLDGRKGKATQKAMELLVRYAEALGADRFVDTNNVAGVPGSANPFLQNYYKDVGGGQDAIFSFFDLDADELVDVPQALVQTCHLQGGADPEYWETLGMKPEVYKKHAEREAFAASKGVQILKTCTPYLAGNVPVKGEHCAWMESSAVVFCNSVIGARTNTEGRESTSAAMLTGKIPDWGLHRTAHRYGTHRLDVEIANFSLDLRAHGLARSVHWPRGAADLAPGDPGGNRSSRPSTRPQKKWSPA